MKTLQQLVDEIEQEYVKKLLQQISELSMEELKGIRYIIGKEIARRKTSNKEK